MPALPDARANGSQLFHQRDPRLSEHKRNSMSLPKPSPPTNFASGPLPPDHSSEETRRHESPLSRPGAIVQTSTPELRPNDGHLPPGSSLPRTHVQPRHVRSQSDSQTRTHQSTVQPSSAAHYGFERRYSVAADGEPTQGQAFAIADPTGRHTPAQMSDEGSPGPGRVVNGRESVYVSSQHTGTPETPQLGSSTMTSAKLSSSQASVQYTRPTPASQALYSVDVKRDGQSRRGPPPARSAFVNIPPRAFSNDQDVPLPQGQIELKQREEPTGSVGSHPELSPDNAAQPQAAPLSLSAMDDNVHRPSSSHRRVPSAPLPAENQWAHTPRVLPTPSLRPVGLEPDVDPRITGSGTSGVRMTTEHTQVPAGRYMSATNSDEERRAVDPSTKGRSSMIIEQQEKSEPRRPESSTDARGQDHPALPRYEGLSQSTTVDTAPPRKDFASVLQRKLSHLLPGSSAGPDASKSSSAPRYSSQTTEPPSSSSKPSFYSSTSASQQAKASQEKILVSAQPQVHMSVNTQGQKSQSQEHLPPTIASDAQDNVYRRPRQHPPSIRPPIAQLPGPEKEVDNDNSNRPAFLKISSTSASAQKSAGRATSADYHVSSQGRAPTSAPPGATYRSKAHGGQPSGHKHSTSAPITATPAPIDTLGRSTRDAKPTPIPASTRMVPIGLPSSGSRETIYQTQPEDETILMTPSSLATTPLPPISQQSFSRSVEQVHETNFDGERYRSERPSARSKHNEWRAREQDGGRRKPALRLDVDDEGRAVPIHVPEGRHDPRIFTPFRYLAARRRRSASLLSLEAQDGTAVRKVSFFFGVTDNSITR